MHKNLGIYRNLSPADSRGGQVTHWGKGIVPRGGWVYISDVLRTSPLRRYGC